MSDDDIKNKIAGDEKNKVVPDDLETKKELVGKNKSESSKQVTNVEEKQIKQVSMVDDKKIKTESSENNKSKTPQISKEKNDKNVENETLKDPKNTKKNDKSSSKARSNQNNKSQKNSNSKNSHEEKEFVEKLVSINRVAKVVKGGRRFSFAALVVVGDGNGMVGHGKGKAKEVPEAIKKATDEAKANLIRVPLRQARTLHHDITGRYDAGKVKLRSAPSGTGVIAGGPMRAIFEALGIKDIVAKSIGTSNPHNMIRATFNALKEASSPKLISLRRGLKVNDITKRRKGASTIQESATDG